MISRRFAAASVLLLGSTSLCFADTLSVDVPSPSIGGAIGTPSDLVSPSVFHAGGAVNTNAFTYGRIPFGPAVIHFSVDRGAVGVGGTAVFGQSTAGAGETASADVFGHLLSTPGTNFLLHDGDGSVALIPPSVGPPGGLIEAGLGDDLDALDLFDFSGQTPLNTSALGLRGFWSVDPGSLGAPGYGGTSSADVFDLVPFPGGYPAPGLYAAAGALGLIGMGAMIDDIDGLEVIDVGMAGFGDVGDAVFFSLAPGSPSLGTIAGASAGGGDIFVSTPGAGPSMFISAASLGLTPTDNLNAFSFAVPEPSAYVVLIAMAALAIFVFRRRRVAAIQTKLA